MQLGADGVFVGSGIFKSGDPEKRARAIVEATTHYLDADVLARVSAGLGEPMVGISTATLDPSRAARDARLVDRARARLRSRAALTSLATHCGFVLALEGAHVDERPGRSSAPCAPGCGVCSTTLPACSWSVTVFFDEDQAKAGGVHRVDGLRDRLARVSGTVICSFWPGPEETLSVTCEPVLALAPSDGDWAMTVPSGSSLGTYWMLASRPAPGQAAGRPTSRRPRARDAARWSARACGRRRRTWRPLGCVAGELRCRCV